MCRAKGTSAPPWRREGWTPHTHTHNCTGTDMCSTCAHNLQQIDVWRVYKWEGWQNWRRAMSTHTESPQGRASFPLTLERLVVRLITQAQALHNAMNPKHADAKYIKTNSYQTHLPFRIELLHRAGPHKQATSVYVKTVENRPRKQTDPQNTRFSKRASPAISRKHFLAMVWFNLNMANVNLILHVLSLLKDSYMCMYMHIYYK